MREEEEKKPSREKIIFIEYDEGEAAIVKGMDEMLSLLEEGWEVVEELEPSFLMRKKKQDPKISVQGTRPDFP